MTIDVSSAKKKYAIPNIEKTRIFGVDFAVKSIPVEMCVHTVGSSRAMTPRFGTVPVQRSSACALHRTGTRYL
jgi:hypothetical protein